MCKQRMRQILGALPCGYLFGEVVVNGNGEAEDYTILEVNHAFSEITSTSRNRTIGRRIAGLFSLSSVKDDIEVFSGVAISGDPVEKEFFSPQFRIPFRVFCFSPKHGFFIALLSDLSREKKLESRLSFFREFCNSTADEFFILDFKGKFVMGNNAVAGRLGTTPERISEHHFSELNSLVQDEWWDTLWKSLLQRKTLQFETEHKGVGNKEYPVELSVDLMEFDGRKYASVVAKNISAKRILSKALRQDRRFAEQAASMAGYFVWMIDDNGVFRPLLGGNSSNVAGPVADVFLALLHPDDRDHFTREIRMQKDGYGDFRMKTERGLIYHRCKWSRVKNNSLVGVCYPVTGSGLSGMGSDSAVMDAISNMVDSLHERFRLVENALEQKDFKAATRIAGTLTANYQSVALQDALPQKVRFDTFLSDNDGMLKQLLEPGIQITTDSTSKTAGFVDITFLENLIVRLLLVIKSTDLVNSVDIRSFSGEYGAGLCVTVSGQNGIQAAIEKTFVPAKTKPPGLASVYAMLRAVGGRADYTTWDDKVEFELSFPKAETADDTAFVVIALPDSVDAARAGAALKYAGFSAAIENSLPEILRRINEENAGILVISDTMTDFSLEELISSAANVTIVQIGGEQHPSAIYYLPEIFRTADLVCCVSTIVDSTAETLQAGVSQEENLWGAPHLIPPLS